MPIFEKSVIEARQRRAGEVLNRVLTRGDELVVVGSGESIGKPGGLDQTYPFLPHPEYYWLSGARRPGGILVYSPKEGWTHFVRPADAVEKLWCGEPEVPEGEDCARFPEWFKSRASRPVAVLGSPILGFSTTSSHADLAEKAQAALDSVRRKKDSAEIAMIRRAVQASVRGVAKAREVIRPGVTERQIQIELESEMLRAGAHGTSFDTIVGTGTHSAVLHFEPSDRVVAASDLVLVDSGAQVHEYASDVTRAFPARDRFTADQQAIYDIVLAGQKEGISKCRAGVEWHEVHRATAAVMAAGLKDLGILTGELDGLLDSGAIALFFPHGVGHMLGLRVRDVGGRAPGRPPGRSCCGATVRVDMPVEEGFVMTVEPGIYFVPAILDDPSRRTQFQTAVNWGALDRWRAVGGVRIEDDVLITAAGCEVLTAAIPK